MSEIDHGPRLGADPELFIQNAEGAIIPICGLIGGTKEEPLVVNNFVDMLYGQEQHRRLLRDRENKIPERIGNYAVQEDNVMLEFNVPAYGDPDMFQSAIGKILHVLDVSILAKHAATIKTDCVSHSFKADQLASHPQALTIGCLPDNNAYADNPEDNERQPFNAAVFGNNRFCGGHLHVQYNTGNVPEHVFAQFMDLAAELPFLRWDKQRLRRMFYGQPGIYRKKPYGIEYRTTSNFWLGRGFREKWLPTLVDNVFAMARYANTDPDVLRDAYEKIDWGAVQEAIKTEDAKMADEIINHVRLNVGLYLGPSATKP